MNKIRMDATAEGAVYRFMRQPPVIGQMRYKRWTFLIAPSGDADPLWVKRCKEYWELQQETFGLKLSDFTLRTNYLEGYVETAVRIIDILPGRRERSYKAPRLQV